jgi:hypothetical protein
VQEALTSRPSSSLSSASRGTTDTPPPTEAQEALLQLADGGIGAQGVASLPAGLDAATEDSTEQLLLQLLPAAPAGNACGEQQHRAHIAQLIKQAAGTASAAGMRDSAALWQEMMGALVEHAAALRQRESPGTEAAVASGTAVEAVELPGAPAVTACAHPADGAGSEQAAAPLTAAAG